jgi:polysaccharide pyruvyl transferase WcaK-like protein
MTRKSYDPTEVSYGSFSRILRILFVRIPGELIEWLWAFRNLRGRTILAITGTGILTDHGEGPRGLPYQMFKWVTVAKVRGMRVFFLSVGVEQINSNLTRWLMRLSLAMAHYVSYRDEHSKQYMMTSRIRTTASVCPDLVFGLPEYVLPRYIRGESSAPVVGVGLFNLLNYCTRDRRQDKKAESQYLEYLKQLGIFVTWLLDNRLRVRFLIGDIAHDNAVRKDLRDLLLRQGVNFSQCKVLDEPVDSVSNLLEQIATTDIVVATRFHNVLLALLLNKPVISISHETKTDSLMDSVGLSEYRESIYAFDASRLITQFLEISGNAGQFKGQIAGRVESFRKASLEQYSAIAQMAG